MKVEILFMHAAEPLCFSRIESSQLRFAWSSLASPVLARPQSLVFIFPWRWSWMCATAVPRPKRQNRWSAMKPVAFQTPLSSAGEEWWWCLACKKKGQNTEHWASGYFRTWSGWSSGDHDISSWPLESHLNLTGHRLSLAVKPSDTVLRLKQRVMLVEPVSFPEQAGCEKKRAIHSWWSWRFKGA